MTDQLQFVIKRYNPWRTTVKFVLFIGGGVLAGVWLYTSLPDWRKHDFPDIITNGETLRDDGRVYAIISTLKGQKIALERNLQIEKQTIKQLQTEMIAQQDEIYRLKKELEFYSGIMPEAAKANGLKIHSLQAEAITDSRGYHFKFVLTHASKNDKVAKGTLGIRLEGILNDTVKIIDIKELTAPESLPLTFNFSSFERLGVNVVLPENFMPHRVIVRASQDDKKKISVSEKIFEWAAIVKN